MKSSVKQNSTAENERYAYIDALRGIAVFGVFMVYAAHLSMLQNLPNTMRAIFLEGGRGVQLFYVISAFTLFNTLEKRRRKERHWLINYGIRRFFRIAPMFYSAVILYLLLYGRAIRDGAPEGIVNANIVATSLFMNGWHPFWINSLVPGGWSVAVETNFYFIMPVLLLFIRSEKRAVLSLICALIIAAVANKGMSITLARHYPHDLVGTFLFFWLPNQLPVFLIGIASYFILSADRPLDTGSMQDKLQGVGGWLSVFAGAGIGLTMIGVLPKHFGISIGFGLLAWGLKVTQWGLLVNRFTCYMGKISFSMYLNMGLCVLLMEKFIGHVLRQEAITLSKMQALGWFAVFFTCLLALSFAISTVTYYLIENPGQRIGAIIIRLWEEKGRGSAMSEQGVSAPTNPLSERVL